MAGVLDSAPPYTVAILTPSSRQVRRLHARRSALLYQWMSHAPRTREREGRRVAVHARSDQLAASDGGPPGRPAINRAERRDAYGWHSGSSRSAWRAERRRYRRRRAMSLVYTCHRGPTTSIPFVDSPRHRRSWWPPRKRPAPPPPPTQSRSRRPAPPQLPGRFSLSAPPPFSKLPPSFPACPQLSRSHAPGGRRHGGRARVHRHACHRARRCRAERADPNHGHRSRRC